MNKLLIAILLAICGQVRAQDTVVPLYPQHSIYLEVLTSNHRFCTLNYSGQFLRTEYLELRGNTGAGYMPPFFSYTAGIDLLVGADSWAIRPMLGYAFAHEINTDPYKGDSLCSECLPYFYYHSPNVGVYIKLGTRWAVIPKCFAQYIIPSSRNDRWEVWGGLQLRFHLK